MLVIDGIKYKLWIPKDEEKEFHPLIKEHSKGIFGENSLYLPIEKKLVSKAGRGVMPDGFAITFSEKPIMYPPFPSAKNGSHLQAEEGTLAGQALRDRLH